MGQGSLPRATCTVEIAVDVICTFLAFSIVFKAAG
jgi:hypothetical protein